MGDQGRRPGLHRSPQQPSVSPHLRGGEPHHLDVFIVAEHGVEIMEIWGNEGVSLSASVSRH